MRSKPSSRSSSPSTPPTPLPVSTGPGNTRYPFTPSPSPSPPFTSPDSSPLLRGRNSRDRNEPAPFSLDMDNITQEYTRPPLCEWTSFFKVWFEWLILRCCCFCGPSRLAL